MPVASSLFAIAMAHAVRWPIETRIDFAGSNVASGYSRALDQQEQLIASITDSKDVHVSIREDEWSEPQPTDAEVSLFDAILAIAAEVPEEEWECVPADLAENYRNYNMATNC